MEPVAQGELFGAGPDHTNLVDLSTEGHLGEDAGAQLFYQLIDSPFGPLLVAETENGLSWLGFPGAETDSLAPLQQDFPDTELVSMTAPLGRAVAQYFRSGTPPDLPWPTDLRGTDFQLAVWRILLTIPTGRSLTYGAVARQVGNPGATQAVGSAVGRNPLTFLIPCHRVVGGNGKAGGYRWGRERKALLVGREVTN